MKCDDSMIGCSQTRQCSLQVSNRIGCAFPAVFSLLPPVLTSNAANFMSTRTARSTS
mgnify:CR=1 FL=1